MDHNRTPKNIGNGKAFIVKGFPRISLVAQNREKISGVIGVKPVLGIVVFSGFRKRLRAVSIFMNVHSIEIRRTRSLDIWKPEKFGFYQNASIGSIIKFDESA